MKNTMLLMYVLAALFALPSCGSSVSQVADPEQNDTVKTVVNDTIGTHCKVTPEVDQLTVKQRHYS